MAKKKAILDLLIFGLVYSVVIIIINIVALLLILQDLNEVVSYLSLITLAEGGLGLIVGGFIGMNSPIIRRIEEDFFRSNNGKPKDKKELEKPAKKLIATGIILVILSLLISVI